MSIQAEAEEAKTPSDLDGRSYNNVAGRKLFTCFGELPTELRLKIWSIAATFPIEVRGIAWDWTSSGELDGWKVIANIPALLLVNIEAHGFLRSIYRHGFDHCKFPQRWSQFSDEDVPLERLDRGVLVSQNVTLKCENKDVLWELLQGKSLDDEEPTVYSIFSIDEDWYKEKCRHPDFGLVQHLIMPDLGTWKKGHHEVLHMRRGPHTCLFRHLFTKPNLAFIEFRLKAENELDGMEELYACWRMVQMYFASPSPRSGSAPKFTFTVLYRIRPDERDLPWHTNGPRDTAMFEFEGGDPSSVDFWWKPEKLRLPTVVVPPPIHPDNWYLQEQQRGLDRIDRLFHQRLILGEDRDSFRPGRVFETEILPHWLFEGERGD